MRTRRITNEEVRALGVSSLPTAPNAPTAFGGGGYTAGELKAVFDRLPCLIIEQLNRLIEDISDTGEASLAAAIPTGIAEGHSLADLFEEIKNGSLAARLTVGETDLVGELAAIKARLAALEGRAVNG